ncbi:MAG: CDP-glycerol glycerophosphotransferase family protein, partial [Eubacterium sp.]|nr:CDP-glycerol glycerophosphotransferase family protein [Eubacterium sp.]
NREFYNSLDIEFDPYNTYYCDMPVATRIICAAKGDAWVNGDSIYIWRHRNDPIHLPAISQKKRTKKIREYGESYEKSLEFLGENDDDMRTALDHEIVVYTMNKFPGTLKGKNCARYSGYLSKMSHENIKRYMKDYKFVSRHTLGFLVKGKFRMAKPLAKFASVMRKKRGLFGKPIQYWKFLDKRIFQKMPLKDNLIFIESFFGKSYSDSPKYLYEYIYNKYGDKYEYVFCLNKRAPEMLGHPKICKRHTLRYVYYTARAKYFICNTRQPAWFKKREGVVFMETWHGTPLKKLAFDLDDIHAASQNHKRIFYRHAKAWDYLVSANPFSTEVFERAFCVPREKIIEVGYPRNDILYSKDKDKIAEDVKREFNIPEGKKVVLYAPTWRDDQFYAKGKYKFTLAMDFARLQKELGDEYVILLRTHYYIADMVDLSEFDGFVFNASKYNDISRLYLASDICITDYSSVFFDYANLKRPILFFAYDYEKYEGELRGMYIDMNKELPGPILKTNDEVVDALKNIDKISSEYASRYDEFYDRFCSVDDGHASERTINIMFGEGNM